MNEKRTKYPLTTLRQRRKMFQVWEATGSAQQAYKAANVSRGTFYFWRPRFEEGGYAALEEMRHVGPRMAGRVPDEVAQKVIALKKENPHYGKLKLAKVLIEGDDEITTISPNTIRRILTEADMWEPQIGGGGKHS